MAAALLLGVVFLRLWYVQVVRADELAERADSGRILGLQKLAPRGLIFDRNGVLLGGVRPELVITAVPVKVRKNPNSVERVARILQIPAQRLWDKIDENYWRPHLESPIFSGVSVEHGSKVAELLDDLPGIGVETQPMRFYPDPYSATHLLGSVRVPTERDVDRLRDKGITPAQYVGRSGVEEAYEVQLMGVPGVERMVVDARRQPLRVIGRDNAVPGSRLILSIDSRLQKLAMNLLGAGGHTGAVVAIEPQTGEVLCLASSPTFNQNLFRGGISKASWNRLLEHPGKPLVNRAIQSAYSPGSTFKIVTALAAQNTGKFSPTRRYRCAGGYRLGRRFARCMGHHGSISFERAMAKSCNTYFFDLAMDVGPDALRTAAQQMGLGDQTGIELRGESSGVVPTEEWLTKRFGEPMWRGGDTLNLGIGQGYITATPLQMANLIAMVANNGVSYVPHLAHAFQDPRTLEGKKMEEPQVASRVEAPPEFWNALRGALTQSIEGGTAQSAKIPGVRWGGKTGSAEHGRDRLTHSWFVGFAPADNPRIAVCVLVEAAGHGGEIAAPIAREIVRTYLTPVKSLSAASSNSSSPRS